MHRHWEGLVIVAFKVWACSKAYKMRLRECERKKLKMRRKEEAR